MNAEKSNPILGGIYSFWPHSRTKVSRKKGTKVDLEFCTAKDTLDTDIWTLEVITIKGDIRIGKVVLGWSVTIALSNSRSSYFVLVWKISQQKSKVKSNYKIYLLHQVFLMV